MSLLTIIQNAASRMGLAAPTVVVGSSDLLIKQLLALANKEGKELTTGASVGMSFDWQVLQAEATFISLAVESQGNINTIAPGFRSIIDSTIWDRTRRLPVYGSVSPQEWQNYKAWGIASPFPKYRVIGNILKVLPIPAAGDAYFFEYKSNNWCSNAAGTLTASSFSSDTDIGILDEDLITDGVIWRFRKAKGLDYAEDFASYQRNVTTAMIRDVERPMLDLSDGNKSRTGVVVPIGSW